MKPKDEKPKAGPAPNAYSLGKLSVVEKSPSHAFGIKHSPYVGALKGDAWVGTTTELATPVASRKGSSSATTTSRTMNGGGSGMRTTVTTRTHSDGTKIRTETLSYSSKPTRTVTTTKT